MCKRLRQLGEVVKFAHSVVALEALAPEALFRAAVRRNGLLVSDVIQVWLDVANHPSRGAEQGELIFRKILAPIISTLAVVSPREKTDQATGLLSFVILFINARTTDFRQIPQRTRHDMSFIVDIQS